MGVWKVMIICMKKGSNHHEKRRAKWGVLCGEEEYTEHDEGLQSEDECQI